eukprot:12372932-Karenia_brevis.AAC.1
MCGRSLEDAYFETTLVDFLDVMLVDNHGSGDLEKTVAAAVYFHPGQSLQKHARLRRALKGARKIAPQYSRLGLADVIWMGIVGAA